MNSLVSHYNSGKTNAIALRDMRYKLQVSLMKIKVR